MKFKDQIWYEPPIPIWINEINNQFEICSYSLLTLLQNIAIIIKDFDKARNSQTFNKEYSHLKNIFDNNDKRSDIKPIYEEPH
jgi:hypothetical protein